MKIYLVKIEIIFLFNIIYNTIYKVIKTIYKAKNIENKIGVCVWKNRLLVILCELMTGL